MTALAAKAAVLVPFYCPMCKAENRVAVLAVSRAGGASCAGCKRRLNAGEVSRAMSLAREMN